MSQLIKNEILESIINDRSVRQALTQKNLSWFIKIFLSDYLKCDFATFQEELMYLAENDKRKILAVMAFRNSGKSTILNLGITLWSILGAQQKKCVVIVSKTQAQAKSHFLNIRNQLENNELLVGDMGPFKSDENEWGMHGLELPLLGAKILSVSREQSLRGIRYNEHRPDLIICDDVEDTDSITSGTERETAYHWFMSEVVPAGSDDAKIIVLGNLLHKDCLLMKLRDYCAQDPQVGIFKAYPIIDSRGKNLWPQKFDSEKVELLERTLSDDVWLREYMLTIHSGDGPIYIIMDTMPKDENGEYPRIPSTPEVPEQKPTIVSMKKYVIKSPLIYD